MDTNRNAAPLVRGVATGIHKASTKHYSRPATDNAGHQRLAVLLFLQIFGPLTASEARQELGVCYPEKTVAELRKLGHNITTTWCIFQDSTGCNYLAAEYELLPGKYKRRIG